MKLDQSEERMLPTVAKSEEQMAEHIPAALKRLEETGNLDLAPMLGLC